MKTELPKSIKILEKTQEAENMFRFTFDYSVRAAPGQFVMVWEGKVDELPISVMYDDGKQLQLLIGAVGDGSQAICAKEVGEYLGIRGPYGSSFVVPKNAQRVAMVAGGYGVAPLYFFSRQLNELSPSTPIDFILGARNKDMLLLVDQLSVLDNVALHIATDDGSEGTKGYTTDVFATLMQKVQYDHVYTVGPEVMMKKVADVCLANTIACHVSIERYMKCGFGVCGQCTVDDTGERMCVEGPIYDAKRLKFISEFGKYHRDATSKKVAF